MNYCFYCVCVCVCVLWCYEKLFKRVHKRLSPREISEQRKAMAENGNTWIGNAFIIRNLLQKNI